MEVCLSFPESTSVCVECGSRESLQSSLVVKKGECEGD